jgi:hypothetical protein
MHPLFSAALLPIIGVSAVLGLRARAQRPALAAYCGALALWAASVLLALWQPTRPLGERMLMAGFFVPVGLLATVREAVGVGTARGVRAFIAVAAGFTLTGALVTALLLLVYVAVLSNAPLPAASTAAAAATCDSKVGNAALEKPAPRAGESKMARRRNHRTHPKPL